MTEDQKTLNDGLDSIRMFQLARVVLNIGIRYGCSEAREEDEARESALYIDGGRFYELIRIAENMIHMPHKN